MTGYEEKLSAFLDGELPEDEARQIEAALARDPALQAELDSLMAADAQAQQDFAEMLEPVPLGLAAVIQDAPVGGSANSPDAPRWLPGWLAVAASVLFLVMGGAGGYLAGLSQGTQVAAAPGWLQDIAEYHAVYAAQTRHLVEVPATEADHIVQWLSDTIGAEVRIPDLAGNGLTFQGARLLVAAGKPVAQLMYTDAGGEVVALCLIRSDTPAADFTARTLNGFDMINWGGRGANIVVVGPEGRVDLSEIAERASVQI